MRTLSRFMVLLTMLLAFGALAQAGVILTPLSPSAVEAMQSINGNQTAGIEFINQIALTVDVNWIDYSGSEVLYATLAPGQSYVQWTFITHPWVIEDHGTDVGIDGFLAQTPQPWPPTSPDLAFITPEPGTLLMFGSSVLGLAGILRRKINL